MRVLALGGSGHVGRLNARILADSGLVKEIVVASRRLEAAKDAAAGLGSIAKAVELDAADERAVASLAADADLVVNTAGPDFKVAFPAIRAAIEAGTHYVDVAADGAATERALSLDSKAKSAGVTALTGIGSVPGLSNLMMVHAARQLDQVEDVRFCTRLPVLAWGDPKEVLAEMRKSGHADASWQTIMKWIAPPVRVYRDRRWQDVDPSHAAVRVTLPEGGAMTAHPIGSTEPITLPRVLSGVRSVSIVMGLFPPALNELYCEQGRRLATGEIDASEAAMAFYERVVADTGRWLAGAGGADARFSVWAEAIGEKQGRRVRLTCWPTAFWLTTTGPLATSALKILRGEIRTCGVLSPEACLDPMPFMEEVAPHGSEKPPGGKLLHEVSVALD